MAFDFLPDKKIDPNKQTGGGGFAIPNSDGKTNVFFDAYQSHLDVQNLIKFPLDKSQFNHPDNYEVAERVLQNIEHKIDGKWYGEEITIQGLREGYTQFAKPLILKGFLQKASEAIPKDLFSELQLKKVYINDRFGIFSFDLASMLMTYVYEYIDSKGDIVDANYITKKENLFIHTPSGKKVTQRIKKRPNGTPVVISHNRNSFIDFKKTQKKERLVELMVSLSFAAKENVNNLIYNALGAILLAENLEKNGYKVKITSMLIAYNSITQENHYHLVPVKNFNATLDPNAAAYVMSDPKYFRYEGFKAIIKGNDIRKKTTPPSVGTIISNTTEISKAIENDYIYNSERLQADTRLYFGGARSEKEALNEIAKAVKILNEKHGTSKN